MSSIGIENARRATGSHIYILRCGKAALPDDAVGDCDEFPQVLVEHEDRPRVSHRLHILDHLLEDAGNSRRGNLAGLQRFDGLVDVRTDTWRDVNGATADSRCLDVLADFVPES